MLRSMTAFGAASVTVDAKTLNLEIRSVNSRFLDIHFRIPEELRHVEMRIRETLSQELARGKIEVRAHIQDQHTQESHSLNLEALEVAKKTFLSLQALFPSMPAPSLSELLQWPGVRHTHTYSWEEPVQHCLTLALEQLQANRVREGERLSVMLKDSAHQIQTIINQVNTYLPQRLQEFQTKFSTKIQETLNTSFPNGFEHITSAELIERITHESSLFSIRVDVAEELTRLEAHLGELLETLNGQKKQKVVGKRLDFLFQEMNREANTLGSKAYHIDITRAAMDLKLVIEQMREQIQNIE